MQIGNSGGFKQFIAHFGLVLAVLLVHVPYVCYSFTRICLIVLCRLDIGDAHEPKLVQ